MALQFLHHHRTPATTWQLQPKHINTITISQPALLTTPIVKSWGLRKFAVINATPAEYVPYLSPADNIGLMFGKPAAAVKPTLKRLQHNFACVNLLLNQTTPAQTPLELALVGLLQGLTTNVDYIVINDILPQLTISERQLWLEILTLVAQTAPVTIILLTQTPLVNTNHLMLPNNNIRKNR